MKDAGRPLNSVFFQRDAQRVAWELLGKVICHRVDEGWLAAQIIETEAYYRAERASHASLGFTERRKALFMPPGTIYMYFARGGDSFNISCGGEGDAVLIKAAIPWSGAPGYGKMIERMNRRNPLPSGKIRAEHRLCSGQTLLCRALGLRVPHWDQQSFQEDRLRIIKTEYKPEEIIRTTRLGIPTGRDGHLPFRFIDLQFAVSATKNPLTSRNRGEKTLEFRPFSSPPPEREFLHEDN